MKKNLFFQLVVSTLVIFNQTTWAVSNSTSASTHPIRSAFCSKNYTNLFADLLGQNSTQIQLKLDKAFNQLFYGDDLTQRIYYQVRDDMAYIQDIHNQDVRTEGMSYGMMIAVQLNRKAEFDRLWKWAKTYMQHAGGPHRGYFAWHCRPDGTRIDDNAASDGEEWFVTALFFAAARWGNGEGLFNYQAEAQFIIDSMFDKGPDVNSPLVVTNLFNLHEKQVVFVPTGHLDDFTDPSYHLPHFYELWALWDEQRREFWQQAAAASRAFLKKTAHPQTGLTPDYALFDGTPCEAPWETGHADFRFDAWRTAMNIALDYAWFRKDEWAVLQSNRLLEFFRSQGIETYGNQYTLDGKMLSADHSLGLVSMNAVACLAATHPSRRQFVEQLWKAEPPSGTYRYYDGLLYMLALLQVSGTFRIYDLSAPANAAVESYVTTDKDRAAFTLCEAGQPAPWYAASTDYPGVRRVLSHVQHDIQRVTGTMPALNLDTVRPARELVLAGTLGKNQIIDRLVAEQRLSVDGLKGQWETFIIQTVDHPLPDVERALVIVGSDKRGTIFGLYDLAEKIGVSPWHFWADVPVPSRQDLYIVPGRHTAGTPKVKYRGIFINDEAPALSGWAYETFGGFNAPFYEKVFELILRLKGNFLWPAMWGRAFYVDDPRNPALADEYGVVVSTSHHEPLMRAHAEWAQFGHGPWNYAKNKPTLQSFWREGVARMGDYESIVTIGMRGDGDEPMSEEANITLLEEIVKDQRGIIADVTGKPVEQTPQVWALYKEVQEYFDKGMRVPDDMTLLLCDDNWGNLRRLPKPGDPHRAGGYGIYYHYDYVGGPRNYKWINTNQIARVWEQMHLAFRHGVDRIWIVNVGDIKPMEFPISFFLDYAWNPDQWPASALPGYTQRWVERQFGSEHHQEIAEWLSRYTRYNSRRKPELLAPDTYSLTAFREAEQVVNDYRQLVSQARDLNDRLEEVYRPAFYQLILHPLEACANLHELYLAVAQNHWYADQGRKETNPLAEKARRLFARDEAISDYYNHTLLNGKWNHMMDQTHIGYTSWQQPDSNVMPPVKTINVPERAEMGVAIEGSSSWWPAEKGEAVLPEFDPCNRQPHYIEIFNRGRTPFTYHVESAKKWIQTDPAKGRVDSTVRLWIDIDWNKVPEGVQRVPIRVKGAYGQKVTVQLLVRNEPLHADEVKDRFIENNHVIAMEAEHYSRAVDATPVCWQVIPGLGRTLSGMTIMPVTASQQAAAGDSPRLEYEVYIRDKGLVTVKAYLSPTLNYYAHQGLRYGISFDDEPVQIVNMHEGRTLQDWERSVSDNITLGVSRHTLTRPGGHVLKFWAVDAGVVLQRIVIETGPVPATYLGPPESGRGLAPAAKGRP